MKLSVKQEQREKYTEMAEGCECVLGQERAAWKRGNTALLEKGENFAP